MTPNIVLDNSYDNYDVTVTLDSLDFTISSNSLAEIYTQNNNQTVNIVVDNISSTTGILSNTTGTAIDYQFDLQLGLIQMLSTTIDISYDANYTVVISGQNFITTKRFWFTKKTVPFPFRTSGDVVITDKTTVRIINYKIINYKNVLSIFAILLIMITLYKLQILFK